ncbi:hypothetical protein EI94DRAFT_1748854 [Lactarius quietus]|nr:hypothetical protein EI94DRAFT_1748854 [Lactarius quietus]
MQRREQSLALQATAFPRVPQPHVARERRAPESSGRRCEHSQHADMCDRVKGKARAVSSSLREDERDPKGDHSDDINACPTVVQIRCAILRAKRMINWEWQFKRRAWSRGRRRRCCPS